MFKISVILTYNSFYEWNIVEYCIKHHAQSQRNCLLKAYYLLFGWFVPSVITYIFDTLPIKVSPSHTLNLDWLTNMAQSVLIVIILATYLRSLYSDCSMMNNCNGHGICNTASSSCDCFEGTVYYPQFEFWIII